jgi:dephospho-CoA kinase
MIRVALTGGIASGKSAVSTYLREHGVRVIDHDVLARDAVAKGSAGLGSIVQTFGLGVLNEEGALNRPALGAIVFSDPARLEQLNQIVHPEVKRLAALADVEARAAGEPVILHDIPLLAETSQGSEFDAVLVVEAPMETRIERMVRDRGMTRGEAQSRIAAQASDQQRRSIASQIIVNDSNFEQLHARIARAWSKIVEMPASDTRSDQKDTE